MQILVTKFSPEMAKVMGWGRRVAPIACAGKYAGCGTTKQTTVIHERIFSSFVVTLLD